MDQRYPLGFGRYAPSPSGDLHLGNLRTALLAWAFARRDGLGFHMRVENLDERSRLHFAKRQLEDVETLGIDWDGPVAYQSENVARYQEVFAELARADAVYECYCTRRELADVVNAPHRPPGAYAGTCRNLTDDQRGAGRAKVAALHRGVAYRLRSEVDELTVTDRQLGDYTGVVDDFVVRRGDGIFAYNFAAIVDDADAGVTQVVRGDDLLPSTPRQVYMQQVLGVSTPQYAHVPLVLNTAGQRLAKRDGAVTLRELGELGWSPADIVQLLAVSLGMTPVRSAAEFLEVFDPVELPREPWKLDVEGLKDGPGAYFS
ncbi:MAG: tRNA glutamyl-Q(34) synthetase GluQRS [Actinomycetaceae bacterium]|nr:tRNA glutamyl-Q(34) synthetase GluQRS [Actinomycetaceae bacterium]